MTDAFEAVIELLLSPEVEGGYVNDPLDPGLETHWGISRRAYPNLNIRELTREQAVEIYRRDYWGPACCGEVPPALGIPLFDSAVNQGVGTAIELLQAALSVKVDGIMGPVTVLAARNVTDSGMVLADFMARRGLRYARAYGFPRNGRGWFRRLFLIHQLAVRFLT